MPEVVDEVKEPKEAEVEVQDVDIIIQYYHQQNDRV